MELMRNLRWMCRVCAVNIRKRRSSSGAVSIFDTPNLLTKLRTYLQMEKGAPVGAVISRHDRWCSGEPREHVLGALVDSLVLYFGHGQLKFLVEFNDKLPKSICANCFKRIESVHNFAVLAKKTENFLKDFISIAESNLKKNSAATRISARFQNEFASFALLSGDKQDIIICEDDITGNEDVSITIDTGDDEERVRQLPEKLRFIEVKQNNASTLEKIAEKFRSAGEKNSLEQKRRNLKMVLANNTSQTLQSQKNYNVIAPPTPPGPAALPGLQMSSEVTNYDCLNLGCVIKDLDLLKLILKALKWPFTKETLNAQIHRLKNTRFRDVMVDPNLLQDTDLMQILSSYLSPILIQPQVNTLTVSPDTNLNSGIMPALEAYKIPADTSVHLVSVPLESERKARARQRQRRRQELRSKMLRIESPIVLSDDEDTRDVQKFEVNVDPTWYFPAESESQENSTESLVMSLVGDARQMTKSNSMKPRKKQRRKEAHGRLRTERSPEERIAVVEKNGQGMKNYSRKKSQAQELSNEELLNSESLRSQFPLVAIIDENSNDDAAWDEFKVVNSPDHEPIREITEDQTFVEPVQMEEADQTGGQQDSVQVEKSNNFSEDDILRHEIKVEVIEDYEHPQIKSEPVEPETILPDVPHDGNANPTTEQIPEQSLELVSIKEEEPEYFEIEEVDIDLPKKAAQEEAQEKMEVDEKEPDEVNKEEVAEEVTEQKITRSKSAGYDTIQKTSMTTRSSSRVQNVVRTRRLPRSTTPRTYSASKRGGRVGRPPKGR